MHHPSHMWTIASGVAMIVWSTGSSVYVRRLLRPVQANAVHAITHANAAESSDPLWAKRAYLDKAWRLTTANTRLLKAARRWNNLVYTPVAVALCMPTLVLALWGVF